MAWQKMPFFNFPHYKSMGKLSCHSNQTKRAIFIKKHKLSIHHPKDATDEIWAKSAKWLQRRCRLKVLTNDDRRQTTTTTTDHCLSYKLPRSLRLVASEEMSFKSVDERRQTTDDRRRPRRTTAYPISSPRAFGSGELKMLISVKRISIKIGISLLKTA